MAAPREHPFAQQWNHNSHYYPLIARAIPTQARRVLDIGCGDGTFCRFVAHEGRLAVGLDAAASGLSLIPAVGVESRTTAADAAGGVGFVVGDMHRLCFADNTFDAVTAVMVLHHGDTTAAVHEAVRVLAPGGVLLVLGYGAFGGWRDLPYEVRDVVTHRLASRSTRAWNPATAVADPARTWAAERRLLADLLPGCSYRRLPMWRYLVQWSKPR